MRKLGLVLCVCLAASAALAGTALGRHHARSHSASTDVSGLDKQWLQTSMQGDLFEIRGGQLALRHSHSRVVRGLALRLIKDHRQSYRDAAKLARELGIDVEHHPTPSEVWELRSVANRRRARAFNRWYTSLEVYDHQQDITETRDEINDGSDADVVAEAKKDLPMLRKHLRIATHAYSVVI